MLFKVIVKKIILFLMSIIFLIFGIIGLIIPVVPQVPFFILSLICVVVLSSKLYHKVVNSKFYINKCTPYINKHKFLYKLDSLARKIVEDI